MNRVINIEDKIFNICPDFTLVAIECIVSNKDHDEELWQEIDIFTDNFIKTHKIEEVKDIPTIKATRQAYKDLGKEPNRYRPSAEALCRRLLKGQELYKISTLVDLINLISIKYGYSIGGFDADKITGDIKLGVGQTGESFNAIGRGPMNVENLPLYRDSIGGIGNPTSDEERTKITDSTTNLLMLINSYYGYDGIEDAITYSTNLLNKYASAKDINVRVIRKQSLLY